MSLIDSVRILKDGSYVMNCPFCEGDGAYPKTIYGDNDRIETDPCPVCKGKGVNIFKNNIENIIPCRFCNETGRAWNVDGYFVGDVCQVCHGLGLTVLSSENGNALEAEFFWKLIHPSIARVSRSRFETNHYADSIESALKEINSCVKNIFKVETGKELDGAQLMYNAFPIKNPVIKFNQLTTESEQNIQEGYMHIFAGAMIGIRNPKAHENVTIDRMRAIHLLFLSSLLMYKLDERI